MKKNYLAQRQFLAKLMVPTNQNVPNWCSSKKEEIITFEKGDEIEIKESQGSVEVTFKKTIYIESGELEKYFKPHITLVSSEVEEATGSARDLWELD